MNLPHLNQLFAISRKTIFYMGLLWLILHSSSSMGMPEDSPHEGIRVPKWYDALRPTKNYMDLGGDWEFCPLVDAHSFVWPPPDKGWKPVAVPADDALAPLKSGADFNWFKRLFVLSDGLRRSLASGERAILHFGGVSFHWEAWLNGKRVISSMDGFNAQDVDVTELIHLETLNDLVVGTSNRSGVAKENTPGSLLYQATPKGMLLSLVRHELLRPTAHPSDPIVGIWGEIELWARPARRIDDVFVRPSFRQKRLDVDVTMSDDEKSKISVRILDADDREVLKSEPVTTAGYVATVSVPWPNPRLWNVGDPYLYTAEVTRSDLGTGKILDVRNVSFGFREIWIEGGNLMINGKRLFLARTSMLPSNEGEADNISKSVMLQKANSVRLHLGGTFRPSAFAIQADKLGFLIVPELPLVVPKAYCLDDSRFWKNYRDIVEGWIKAARNHASIAMWSLSNEILWDGATAQNAKCPGLMYEVGLHSKAIDPTRPIQYDGDWDLPPDDDAEIVNLHYPWEPSAHWYPTECWAFENPDAHNPPVIASCNGNNEFRWRPGTKPIIVGEFSWLYQNFTSAPVAMTMYGGDRVYDWEEWKTWKLWRQLLRWQCDAWRVARFAGINPWYHMPETWSELMPLKTVVLRDSYRCFFAGKAETFDAVLLNDTWEDSDYQVTWAIIDKGKVQTKGSCELKVGGGEMGGFKMTFVPPMVPVPSDMELVVELSRRGVICNTERYPVRIRPQVKLTWPDHTLLLDPAGESRQALVAMGMAVKELKNVSMLEYSRKDSGAAPNVFQTNNEEARAVVVGHNGLVKLTVGQRQKLRDFVRAGGTILTLGETKWPNEGFGLAGNTRLVEEHANRAWVRSQGHPLLSGIADGDLAYWRNDDWVVKRCIEKPMEADGVSWRTLIDVGPPEGLANAALIEVLEGKGRYLINQLELEKAAVDPGARALLAEIFSNLNSDMPPRTSVTLLTSQTSPIAKFAAEQNIAVQTEWNQEDIDTPLIVEARDKRADPLKIAKWVERGGRAWVSNINASNVGLWAAAVNGGISLDSCDPPEGCLVAYEDPLLWGISNEELFWAHGYWTEAASRTFKEAGSDGGFPGVQRLARIAQFALRTRGIALLKPATLVKVQQGRGQWLLSTINLEDGRKKVSTKVFRLLEALFMNLGIASSAQNIAQYDNFLPISLSGVVNRGFQDEVADNGKGGWSDQAPCDLRFFPVNLSGFTVNGLPDLVPKEFPKRFTFEGIDFEILDPREHGGKSCLILEPDYEKMPMVPRGDYVPVVKNLPVGRFFDSLFSLHGAVWDLAPQGAVLWTYVLHYADGSSSELPVRNGIEVADWYRPSRLEHAHVAWLGEAIGLSPIGLYSASFKNPHPDKRVISIDVVSSKTTAIPGIIALSTGDLQSTKP